MRSNLLSILSVFAGVLAFSSLASGQLVDQGGYTPEDADINGSKIIDRDDANLLMSAWGNTQSALDIVDLSPANGPTSDGIVDVDDLNLVQIFTESEIFQPLSNRGEARGGGNFLLRGVDIGGDPQNSGLLKGSPIRTSGGSAYYTDSAAFGFIYAPTMGELISEPSLEYTSYVALSTGPTTPFFTADTPDFSTPGFTGSSGHFDILGEVRGAWYTDAGVPSSLDYPGQGEGVHVLRLSVPRGETLETSGAIIRVLVEIGGTNYVVNLPLQGGTVMAGEFGGSLPTPLEARAILAAQPDNVGAIPSLRGTGVDLDVYDVYVAESTVITVEPNGKGDFTTIQAAVDAASSGDTINVMAGTYSESVDLGSKNLTIQADTSARGGAVILDGGSEFSLMRIGGGQDSGTLIDGLTFMDGFGTNGGAIIIDSSSPRFTNCVISTSDADFGAGVFNNGGLPDFISCEFVQNDASFGGGGVFNNGGAPDFISCEFVQNDASFGGAFVNNGTGGLFQNCLFYGNTAGDGAAINNQSGAVFTLEQCTIANNTATISGGAISNINGSDASIVNSILFANSPNQFNGDPTDVTYSIVEGGFAGTGNIDADPLFVSPSDIRGSRGIDYSLSESSPAIDAGDNTAIPGLTIDLAGEPRLVDDPGVVDTGNGAAPIVDMGAYEFQGTSPLPTIFVNANADGEADGLSWDGAFTDLQDAIDLIGVSGDENTEVFVARGTYVPQSNGTRGTDFAATFTVPNGASLIGGFSGDGSETDASQADPANNVTILSGDTNGDDEPNFANRSDNRWHVVTLAQQGGVTATLEGFTISGGNANGPGADANGGGIFVGPQGVTLIDCVVTDNMAANNGAGVYLGTPSIQQNRGGSPSDFNGTLFSGNRSQSSGGAVFAQDPDSIAIQSCRFENNSAASGDGGAVWVANTITSTTIYDSVFELNSAESGLGGALYAQSSGDVQIEMSEFMSNTALDGGAIARDSISANDEMAVTDCMFGSNSSSDDGGAVYADISAGEIILVNSGFFQNDAGGVGGAAHVRESIVEARGDTRFFTVDQCVFANNSVPEAGAAISVIGEGIDVFIAQSSFGGHADANSVLVTDENLTLVNCAFGENSTDYDVLAFGFGNSITFNIFQALGLPDDPRSDDGNGTARGSSVFDNIEGVDPLFADASSGDLDLLPNSPAIDAGDSRAASLAIDFLGRDRFRDDTGTPDTGISGEPERGLPIVDIGAYEFQGTSISPGSFPFTSMATQIDEGVFTPALRLADLDGDSDLDVIACQDLGKGFEVVWYENSRGDLSSLPINSLAFEEAVALDAGDFDNDGDTDVLLITDNAVRISLNNGATDPSFSNNATFVPGLSGVRTGKLGDIDNDGDLDAIIGLGDGTDALRWYENTADEFRGQPQNNIAGGGDFTGLDIGDIDDDGDLDIAAYNDGTGTLSVFLNSNAGSTFAEVVVDASANVRAAPVLADIDRDGSIDVVYVRSTGGERGDSTEIVVGFNNGNGAGFNLVSAGDPMGLVTSLSVADIDGDGDLDAAAGDIGNSRIVWIENNGDGTFDTFLAFQDSNTSSIQLALADMTLDGDADLVAFDSNEGVSKNLLLVENLLIHRDTDFPSGLVLAREANGITTTDAADLDGDGDLDLISGSFFDSQVIWYENPGTIEGIWDHHQLDDQITTGVTSVHALDFDNDGDLDIAATGIVSNSVDIYFNEIDENSGDPTAFTGLAFVDGSLIAANDVRSGDFDNDGDLDLLAVGTGANEILIALNPLNGVTRGAGGIAQTVSVTTMASGVRAAVPVDVDNDGDLDIMSAEFTGGEVRWYDNTGAGDGTTWERNFIAGVGASPIDLVAGDFDRDGDADVAFADFATGDLWWYQNKLVTSQLWEANIFASDLGGPSALTVCDINDDGFPDLAVANRFSNRVRYYINSRAIGEFDSTDFIEAGDSPVTTTAMGVQSVGSADLDGDGRCDLFAGTFAGDAMIRYRNLGGQFSVESSGNGDDTVVAGTQANVLTFELTHLGIDSDTALALSEVNMLLRDGNGLEMDSIKAAAIFDTIAVESLVNGRGQMAGEVLGSVSDFSGVSDGVLSVPIDTEFSGSSISAGISRSYSLMVALKPNAVMNSQGGFQIEITDPNTPSAVHSVFNSGGLILQGDPAIDTGVITITDPPSQPCVADCDDSGVVNFSDLICILGNFGLDDAPGDVDGSGTVNFTDLVSALAFFGPCDN